MSVWPVSSDPACPGFGNPLGDLVFVRVSVDPRSLEDLLEALAQAPFPINPEIRHGIPSTVVEFPAYKNRLDDVRNTVLRAGLSDCRIDAIDMLTAIR